MPISEDDIKEARQLLKQLDQILEGLQNKAAAETAHPLYEGEPPPRPNRIR